MDGGPDYRLHYWNLNTEQFEGAFSLLDTLSRDDAYWWVLSLGACFGGNATIVAAACNVAASGMAARAGYPIGFVAFLRYGLVATLVTLLLATAYIMLRYA